MSLFKQRINITDAAKDNPLGLSDGACVQYSGPFILYPDGHFSINDYVSLPFTGKLAVTEIDGTRSYVDMHVVESGTGATVTFTVYNDINELSIKNILIRIAPDKTILLESGPFKMNPENINCCFNLTDCRGSDYLAVGCINFEPKEEENKLIGAAIDKWRYENCPHLLASDLTLRP